VCPAPSSSWSCLHGDAEEDLEELGKRERVRHRSLPTGARRPHHHALPQQVPVVHLVDSLDTVMRVLIR
jgi:hypothetical protein